MTTTHLPAGKPAPLEHDYEITPGDFLRAELHARGISQADLALRAGVSAKHLNQVIQDVVPLSTDTALRLERVLGISADLLGQLDASHQAQLGRTKAAAKLADYRAWFAKFSLADLVRHGVVRAQESVDQQISDLLDFFSVAEPAAYEKVYTDAVQSFRRAQHLEVNPYATALWLRLAERKAGDIDVQVYDKSEFASLVHDLATLTVEPFSTAFPILQERCARVGVAVVYTPAVAGTRASAAVRWLGPDRPTIALTGRGGYEDSVWFGFFHEVAHVLLHPRRKSLIEFEGSDDGDGAETQANDFAKKVLLKGRLEELSRLDTAPDVEAFAAELGIHPGIAGGIRAYEMGRQGFRTFTKLRKKLDDTQLV